MRLPINDPLQRRRKDVLLRGDRQVIEAADQLARRYGVSRTHALNAIIRAFVLNPEAPERFGDAAAGDRHGTGAATAEAYRQEASR